MYIREIGDGPPVLLSPGCPGPAEHFNPLARALSGHHRVLLPDLPGYGASAPLDGVYTLPRAQTMIEDSLLARGIREVAIVGLSLGAYRALRLAVSERVKVTQVVSLGGFAHLPVEMAALMRQFAATLRAGTDVREAFASRMFSERYACSHPEQVQKVTEWLATSDLAVVAAELDATANAEDLREQLRAVSIPMLARVGQLDVAAPPSFSQEIASTAPRGIFEVAEGCGHLLLLEDWEQSLASIQHALEL